MKALYLLAALPLAACGSHGTAIETRIQIEKVPVRAPCPDADTYKGLVADQPVKLVNKPRPATAQERTAQTAAQLGKYEAKGGWADRARAALDRCQAGGDLTAKP